MLGRSHVVLGALGWLAAAPLVASTRDLELSREVLAASTVACAGAALLPDLDHPGGTIAKSLGPLTEGLAMAMNGLFGGHRKASHGLLFAGVTAALVQLLQTLAGRRAMAVLLFVVVSFALRALKPPEGSAKLTGTLLIAGQAGAVTAAAWAFVPGAWPWMPYAVGAGCVLHLLGDFLTKAGVPLFWPFRQTFCLPILGFPGDGDEKVLASLMTGALAWLTIRAF